MTKPAKPTVFYKCPVCGFYHPKGSPKLVLDVHHEDNCYSIADIDELRDKLSATGSRRKIIVEE